MCLLERGSDGSFQLAVLTGIDETLLWGADNTYITTTFKDPLKTKRTSVFQKGSYKTCQEGTAGKAKHAVIS